MAWMRGLKPGLGTIVQPLVVGFMVSGLLDAFDEPDAMWIRVLLLVLSFPVVAVGVAGYLAVDAGAGPTEAAALAFDPPVPFKWSYSVVQGGGALLGWLCGAAIGPGTVIGDLPARSDGRLALVAICDPVDRPHQRLVKDLAEPVALLLAVGLLIAA